MSGIVPFILVSVLGSGTGEGLSIDLAEGWRFKPDVQDAGLAEAWYGTGFPDEEWAVLAAGKRWEDQGFPDLDGAAWYRKWVEIPPAWRGARVWFVAGGVNDCYTLFCNGKRICSFGDGSLNSVYTTPTVADLTDYVSPGRPNLIAVRVHDWSGSGGLVLLPCRLTTVAAELPNVPGLTCHPCYDESQLVVDVSLKGLPNERTAGTVRIDLMREGQSRVFATRAAPVLPGQLNAQVAFRVPRTKRNCVSWEVTGTVVEQDGSPLGSPRCAAQATQLAPGRWPAPYDGLKVLNNFVTELLSVRIARDGEGTYAFQNPRDGWVFFSVADRASEADSIPRLYLDSSTEALCLRANPDTSAREAMRYLSEGSHELRVSGAGKSALVVRTVPWMGYTCYPGTTRIAEQGTYNWDYLERHVLPHVNMLVASSAPPENELDAWAREGRKWLAYVTLWSVLDPEPPDPKSVEADWASTPGFGDPRYGGIIIDEFGESPPGHYRAWTESVRLLGVDPMFGGKTLFAYCGLGEPLDDPTILDFYRTLMNQGYYVALERYLAEQPTAESARIEILRALPYAHRAWIAAIPGIESHLVMNIGYKSLPPFSLNTDPGVNFKVFMEMQFRVLALDPTFWRTAGVMEYVPHSTDEEVLRWAHRLFRHYCIDGARTPLSNDPYILPHLDNPDFADGLRHWRVDPAVEGSIATKSMKDLGRLQGREQWETDPAPKGDHFVCLKRDAGRPNRVSQTLKALKPGQVYSLKLYSADLAALDVKQRLALSIEIRGADILPKGSFQSECASYSLFVPVGGYSESHPIWLNYHRILFRPSHRTAELIISDWATPDDPSGPIGQELAVNFVEVQPYLTE